MTAVLTAMGCGNTTPGGPGGPGNTDPWISSANGTISSSDSGSTVSGSISKGQVFAVHAAGTSSNGNVDIGVVEVVAEYAPGSSSSTGTMTFTKPVGASAITLVSTVGIKGTPGTGDYTNTSTNACGGLVFEVNTGNTVSIYEAVSPYDCEDSSTQTAVAGSSFDLHISSISVLDSTGNVVTGQGSASWAYYKVSGTLTATLVNAEDTSAPTVNVSLSF